MNRNYGVSSGGSTAWRPWALAQAPLLPTPNIYVSGGATAGYPGHLPGQVLWLKEKGKGEDPKRKQIVGDEGDGGWVYVFLR